MTQRGYTLIELLAVLTILAVLAAMSMPLVQVRAERAREQELKRSLWEIRDAIDAYHAARLTGAVAATPGSSSSYPPELASLTRLQPDARPDHRGEMLRFLRKVPKDPFADPTLPAEQSWGVRSFESEADHPLPGADVYDVYSRSPAVALNGVPLAQW